jgi:hypothetical protein
MVDGQFVIPTSWGDPHCDRCRMLDCVYDVLYNWDGTRAWPLISAYQTGTHGYPQSAVMAYSWALVLVRWFGAVAEDPDDPMHDITADPMYEETMQVITAVAGRLSEEERIAALELAHEVFDIATKHGAFWV